MKKYFLILLSSFLLLSNFNFAQESYAYSDMDLDYKKAISLFNKNKYGAAQKQFKVVIDKYANTENLVKTDAKYYYAVCAVELFNKDAEYLMTDFLNNNPESPRVEEAYFVMATFKYRENKFDEALVWYKKVNTSILKSEEKNEYYFKSGYCMYLEEDYNNAFNNFKIVKETNSKYKIPSLYYYSHIAYIQKKYETALVGFQTLSDDKMFAPVVPYYITQIYFMQSKYDDVISYAPPFLKQSSVKRRPEIARVIGESHYRKQEYEKALPYIEQYHNESKQLTQDDFYSLGYIYYRTGSYDKAREMFNKVLTANDTVAQNAYYHLADCYIKTNKKEEARNAFFAAMKYDINPEIQKDAHFSYAKLTYQLSHSPFNEAIKTFEDYIEKYSDCKNIDEVYSFLVKVYLSSKNYKDALASIERINKRNSELDMAYQRIAFYRGLELFNNLNFTASISMLDKSLKYGMYNKQMKALAFYWKAEAFYRTNNYSLAAKNYNDFLLSPGAIEQEEYNLAHYNLAYSYFMMKQYSEAAVWFRKYTDITHGQKSRIRGDAFNRTGDSYFMLKDYNMAIRFYDNSIKENILDVDYATFQKGFCFGLLRNLDEKISILKKMVDEYTHSSYRDDALFEIAKSYMAKDKNSEAAKYYESLVKNYPNSSYIKESLIQLGLIYYNANEYDKSLEVYKRVINDYKGSIEARNALVGIKNIYIGKSDVDGYMNYVGTLGDYAQVSYSEQDSLTYITAEDAYMKGECEKAIQLFDSYTTKFPNGIFSLNSHYYKADCLYSLKKYEEALVSYKIINQRQKNIFTEQSLLNSANINWTLENYEEALENFKNLEQIANVRENLLTARLGQLRCAEKLNNPKATIEAANKLLITDKITDELVREANFLMAKSYEKMKDTVNMLIKYRTVALDINSAEGSESKYKVAEILFYQKKYAQSEKEILDFLEKNSPHKYWLANSYILWADIFKENGDYFQAKHSLQSIIDNYPEENDGILEKARAKYQLILELENIEVEKDTGDIINFEETNNSNTETITPEQSIENIEEEVQEE
jgi:tetratricopeptide (TPR) repeat protein